MSKEEERTQKLCVGVLYLGGCVGGLLSMILLRNLVKKYFLGKLVNILLFLIVLL